MTVPDRARLNDYCAKGLIRRFRKNALRGHAFERPRVDRRDIEDLRCRWALSDFVGALAKHIVEYPREAKSSIDFVETISRGEIPGAVDARATLLEQTLNCDPTLFVVSEPASSFANGPNHLVAWTLREAEEAIIALLRRERNGRDLDWIHERARLIDAALRNQTLREVALSPLGKSRPGLSALRTTARSRASVYRLALRAFEAYEKIEALDQEAIGELLLETLIAPLEDWQMLELSAALSAADALAKVVGDEAVVHSSPGKERLVASAGACNVHWQRSLPQREDEELDPSEALAKELALSIGSDTASSRVDVSIIEKSSGRELAHIECKWFENESSASSSIADACVQITRYARDSRPASIAEARDLLRDSLIVVASRSHYEERTDGSGPIGFTDFEGLESGSLGSWAVALAKRHSLPSQSI